MRVPLITPLAARDGTVEKDERLVNCFGEQDIETKTTMVIKRAGIDEGDAVISGNDIYGQGLFNYDGYLFMMFGDVLGFWVYVGGSTQFGGGGGSYFYESLTGEWDSGTTYNIGDEVWYEGQKLYSYSDNNIGNTPPSNIWGEDEPGVHTYQGTIDGSYTGEVCSSADAAGYSAWLAYPYDSCINRNLATNTWITYVNIVGSSIKCNQYNTYGGPPWCVNINDFGIATRGTITQLT